MTRSPWITRAIESIDGSDWMPVRYPGAVTDPDAGELISDAEVAETPYTAFSGQPPGHRPTDRAPGQDANHLDGLFPMWRRPPFFTKSEVPTVDADVTYRNCAIVGGVR